MAKHKHSSSKPSRKGADGDGRLWLYGIHAVRAALANPLRRCRRLLVTAAALPGIETVARNGTAGTPAPEISQRHAIERHLPGDAVHQGMALLVDPLPPVGLDDVLGATAGRSDAVIVVLDQATDPRNVGAVLRSAAAFDVGAVVVPRRHAPEVTGSLAKAASGALESVPVVRAVNLARGLRTIKEAGFWCVGLDAGDGTAIAEAELSGRLALVLGAEGSGLRRLTREACDILVRIPLAAGVDSLNLSASAAIALYEVRRRS
jgi:23S rRNA (guanosine2251-2'-O)-methyltransferase